MKLLLTDIRPVPYQVQGYYSHLSPEDSALWTTYIKRNPDLTTICYYDFPVGSVPDLAADDQVFNYERYARQTYSKRIDVVLPLNSTFNIAELKPHAGMVALGQVLMYIHCIAPLLPEGATAKGMIITDSADVDLLPLAAEHNIELVQLSGEPTP